MIKLTYNSLGPLTFVSSRGIGAIECVMYEVHRIDLCTTHRRETCESTNLVNKTSPSGSGCNTSVTLSLSIYRNVWYM